MIGKLLIDNQRSGRSNSTTARNINPPKTSIPMTAPIENQKAVSDRVNFGRLRIHRIRKSDVAKPAVGVD